MANIENVINGLECCIQALKKPSETLFKMNHCEKCPYYDEKTQWCWTQPQLLNDALTVLKEQQKIIEQYHRADGFLDVPGWKWD